MVVGGVLQEREKVRVAPTGARVWDEELELDGVVELQEGVKGRSENTRRVAFV
jgi:uncharacterized protein YabE (DUF348 family)